MVEHKGGLVAVDIGGLEGSGTLKLWFYFIVD